MKRLVSGILLATIAGFFWGFLYWGANPLPYSVWKQTNDDQAAQQALREHFPESGTYYLPGMYNDEETLSRLSEAGPVGFVHISLEGRPVMQPDTMIQGFLLILVTVVIAALILQLVALPTYGQRLKLAVLVGLAGAVMIDFGQSVWWHISWAWKLQGAIYDFTVWVVSVSSWRSSFDLKWNRKRRHGSTPARLGIATSRGGNAHFRESSTSQVRPYAAFSSFWGVNPIDFSCGKPYHRLARQSLRVHPMWINRRRFWGLVGLFMVRPLMAGPGKGKGKGRGKGKPQHATRSESATNINIGVVVGEHRRIVGDYIDHYPAGGLPPGLAKRGGTLPPGLQKHLRKNGTLPPGLQKKIERYPRELSSLLPPLGDDYQGGFLEGRVVIFNRQTSVVVDVFIP